MWEELNTFIHLKPYLRYFIPGLVDLAMAMKRAATLEPLEKLTKEQMAELSRQGKPVRKPRRVMKWEWGRNNRRLLRGLRGRYSGMLSSAVMRAGNTTWISQGSKTPLRMVSAGYLRGSLEIQARSQRKGKPTWWKSMNGGIVVGSRNGKGV
jgi:hypothetical protein